MQAIAYAGLAGYANKTASDFQQPLVEANWGETPAGKGVSYLTDPLAQDTVIAGSGYASLWFKADQDDAHIEVVLSEVTPDGKEFRIQNGLLRAGHRKVDATRSNAFRIEESFTQADYQKLPRGEFTEVRVPIFPVATALRKGSRLRVQINTPGRDLPLWFFETSSFGDDNTQYAIGRGGDRASSILLPTLSPGTVTVPAPRPPCPSLRGQVCRPYTPATNTPG